LLAGGGSHTLRGIRRGQT